MIIEEEFKKLPYLQQLKVLILEAQKEHDIYTILLIDQKIKEAEKDSVKLLVIASS